MQPPIEPADNLPEPLRSIFAQLTETLAHIIDVLAHASTSELPAILNENRATFYRAMADLGDGIIDFLAEGPASKQVESVRAQVVTPIRAWSATSPIFNRMALPSLRGHLDFEVPTLIIENRQAGADFPSVVMNDFYLHGFAARAVRNRFALLTRHLLHEVNQRTKTGGPPVRMLDLTCSSRTVTVNLDEEPTLTAIQLTCLGEDAAALRNVRAKLTKYMNTPPKFLRVSPLKYAHSPLRHSQAYDICYSAMLLDSLSDSKAVTLMSDCYGLLAPEGVLILGCPTRGVPISERVLIAWILGLTNHYRDETDLGKLLAQTPFRAEDVRFELEPLGGDLAIIATRS
jgi:SAM-dependent methyltransferase